MRKRTLHCTHVSHTIKCTCSHVRYLHGDQPELERPESGHCTVRRCPCEEFRAASHYTDAQIQHHTVPIEGEPATQFSKAGDLVQR